MSWKFPKHRPRSSEVLSSEDMNENFLAPFDELSGELNEHNFLDGFASAQGTRLHTDAGLTTTTTWTLGNPTLPAAVGSNVPLDFTDQWAPVLSGPGLALPLEVSFTSVGGTLWILASFQALLTMDGGMGYNFALELDGSVLYESLFGGGDLGNDLLLSATPYTSNGPAVEGKYIPVVLEAQVVVPPGNHTVKVVARTLRQLTGQPQVGLSHRELTVIQLLR